MQDKIIWCGDLNSHNPLSGSNSTDDIGLVVEEFIDSLGLVFINNEEGTRYNNKRNTEAALDLTFVSSAIAGVSTWNVLKHDTVGSDHYPVMTKIGR